MSLPPLSCSLDPRLREVGIWGLRGILISFLQNFREEMKGWVRVSSSSLGRGEVCRFWERMKKRAILVVNKLECKLLGEGVLLMLPLGQTPLMLPLGLPTFNEILALNLSPSMHTYP